MQKIDSKTTLLEHSLAKIKLLQIYLDRYIAILSRVPSVRNIHIFDLFCGEGIYLNDAWGSPPTIIDSINRNFTTLSNPNFVTHVWFNDKGYSKIESKRLKIDRVRDICDQMKNVNINIEYTNEEYNMILPKAMKKFTSSFKSKGLFFIDPYGYKDIDPKDLKMIIDNNDAEVLLFLPIAFMYRFARKALETNFVGGEALSKLLNEIKDEDNPVFSSPHDFITKFKEYLKTYIGGNLYIDTFPIERDRQNIYCLFFFTHNQLGFEKMLEAKWNIDKDRGHGHTLEKSMSVLNDIYMGFYRDTLYSYLQNANPRTNRELYTFGLEQGFLPKHTAAILKGLKAQNRIEIIPLDAKPVRGFYIERDPVRSIAISWRA